MLFNTPPLFFFPFFFKLFILFIFPNKHARLSPIPIPNTWLCGRFSLIASRFLCRHWLSTSGVCGNRCYVEFCMRAGLRLKNRGWKGRGCCAFWRQTWRIILKFDKKIVLSNYPLRHFYDVLYWFCVHVFVFFKARTFKVVSTLTVRVTAWFSQFSAVGVRTEVDVTPGRGGDSGQTHHDLNSTRRGDSAERSHHNPQHR